jgi:hypothetical protein
MPHHHPSHWRKLSQQRLQLCLVSFTQMSCLKMTSLGTLPLE